MSIFLQHIANNEYNNTLAMLADKSFIPTLQERNDAICVAIKSNATDILHLLISDGEKRFDPAVNDNQALINVLMYRDNQFLEILLSDSRVDPAAQENTAIRLAAGLGNTQAVSLLLAEPRVDPAANDHAAIRCATEMGYCEVIRLLLPHLFEVGIPWTTFFDLTMSDADLIQHVDAFIDNNSEYISKMALLTDAQCAALELLMRQDDHHQLEMEQIAALGNDSESAMSDSKVIKSREFFTIVQTHFDNIFNEFGNTDAARVVAIEKSIRGMILDTISADSIDDDQKAFITLHREVLVSASDQNIMKLAREKYFNSKAPNHAAWRCYDAHAPYRGEHINMLTPPSENVAIFSTVASHQGAITSVVASDEIRKMMAYYYLLVTDQNDPEMLTSRKVNFISELADLRLTHSSECGGNDAPSCYPGYLGRMLNLAYGHSLSKHLVTPKNVIMEFLSPIILDLFKSELQDSKSAELCEQYLQALSWLTLSQAKAIVLGQSNYSDELLLMRREFLIKLNFDRKGLYLKINQLLKDKGLAPLDKVGRDFVKLCLLDPSFGFNFGRLGTVYSNYIQKNYPATPIKAMPKATKVSLNPFKAQYLAAKKMNKAHATQLATLQRKSQLFKKLKNEIEAKAKQELAHDENTFDPRGMVLLLKTAITEMPNDNLDAPSLFNETFEKTLIENVNSDEAFPQALHILQIFKNRSDKPNAQSTPKKPLPMAESPSKAINIEQKPIKRSVVRKLFRD